MHPHRLRHTLATQAINRGMRLEAIAPLLGHRSLRMTTTYARIANTTIADEYAAAQAQVDALYDGHDETDELRQPPSTPSPSTSAPILALGGVAFAACLRGDRPTKTERR